MPTASVNGIDLHFERSGEGERLLYLNGSGATLASTGMLLAPFAATFDLLAYDQRGLGETTVAPGPYTMADYAADALGLLDHVGWDACRVVGISFGGMVAQELAVTAPERVSRLALLCTSPGGPDLASYPLHELAGLAPAERDRVGTSILDTRFTPEWLADPAHETDRFIAELMASRGRVQKADEVRRGEHEQLQARRGHDVVDRLDRIACPTLVAAGRYDGIAPLGNSEAIAERIPNAELRVYEGGHAFFGQDPKAVPDVIRWLAER